MAFRKRNVGLTGRDHNGNTERNSGAPALDTDKSSTAKIPGTRRSPIDGRFVTSTGAASVDNLLAGHSGLPLGCSLLIEENATTDYAGTLLRYFAAEGIVQQHYVHAIGVDPTWGKDLPGVTGAADSGNEEKVTASSSQERMKIAWRYQKLGDFEAEKSRVPSTRGQATSQVVNPDGSSQGPFCHSFDLTKRLSLPHPNSVNYIPVQGTAKDASPFKMTLEKLQQAVAAHPDSMHRIVISSLISPASYPPEACLPNHVLQFVHGLQALLKEYPDHLCIMVSLSLALYPRMHGMVRWIELLFDGVLELVPFPHTVDFGSEASASVAHDDKPMGMVKVHRLPEVHARGIGTSNVGISSDLAFTVTKRRFHIKPYSLPPVDGDTEAQQGQSEPNKASLEF